MKLFMTKQHTNKIEELIYTDINNTTQTNNIDIMLKWRIIGIEFEKIYYSEFYTDNYIVVQINKYERI